MNLPALIAALCEAVNPKWRRKRNRHRLTSLRVRRCVNFIARTSALIRAMPVACRKLHRRFFPPKRIRIPDAVCGCCDPDHPRNRLLDREREWPRFKRTPKGSMKHKVRDELHTKALRK